MDAPYLNVAVYPDPDDDRTLDDIRELLLERGARPDGDSFFVERQRRMLLQSAFGEDPRPVEILMSAGPLGDPGYSRREVAAFARYATGLLTAVAERTRPLYGGIGFEAVFPTPDELRSGAFTQGLATDPLFVRRDLLTRSDLGTVLAGEFRRAVEGPAGTVFASWWPFVDGNPATSHGLSAWDARAGGQILGRVAVRYIAERERAVGNGQ